MRRFFNSYQPGMMMRLSWPILAAAMFFIAAPSRAEPYRGGPSLRHDVELRQDPANTTARYAEGDADQAKPEEPDTDLFALMSGKCPTLKVAGRDFACRTVAYAHRMQGRAYFTIAPHDPST